MERASVRRCEAPSVIWWWPVQQPARDLLHERSEDALQIVLEF